jgi:N-acetylmuramoyl-L-alanine amidase
LKTRIVCGVIVAAILGLWLGGCANPEQETPKITGNLPPRTYTKPMPPTSPVKPVPKPIIPIPKPGSSLSGRTFIVDAGHGGRDPGAGAKGYSEVPEKILALNIARDVETLLKGQGGKVIMTRSGDSFIELDERAAMADRYNADLLVAIHLDSNKDRSISGPSEYVSRDASSLSRRIASSIHKRFLEVGISSRGVRQADFRVLVKHSRPAVLVETGYLTNATEARNLNMNGYQVRVAKAIVAGITDVLGRGN